MRNGLYITTSAKNLREYNARYKDSETETRYIGFYMSANGYKQRFYMDFIRGTSTSVGDPYNIYFNEQED